MRRDRNGASWLLGSQDTFYVGNMKGVGRIYQQTFVDTYRESGLRQAVHDQDADRSGRSAE